MNLIPEAKNWWRMFSVQAMLAAGTIQGVWLALPDDLRASVPDSWLRVATIALLLAGVAGRVVSQPKVHE